MCYFFTLSAFLHADTLTANLFQEEATFMEAMTSLKQQTQRKQNNILFLHYFSAF